MRTRTHTQTSKSKLLLNLDEFHYRKGQLNVLQYLLLHNGLTAQPTEKSFADLMISNIINQGARNLVEEQYSVAEMILQALPSKAAKERITNALVKVSRKRNKTDQTIFFWVLATSKLDLVTKTLNNINVVNLFLRNGADVNRKMGAPTNGKSLCYWN